MNGVVGNVWYDRALRRPRMCTETPPASPGARGDEGPDALLVTTVGDELELATGGAARTWTMGQKGHAAVFLAGHVPDGAVWLDDARGVWTTSARYGGDAKLPGWLRTWNAERPAGADFGREWTSSVPPEGLARLWAAPGAPRPAPFTIALRDGRPASQGGDAREEAAFVRTWTRTPFAIEWVFRSALRCVEAESLGADDVPDLLAVNVSTLDYLGHGYGPDAPLYLDALLRTDRALAEFLRGLDAKVPGGLASCVVVVTSDHGLARNGHAVRAAGLPGGPLPPPDGSGVSRLRDAAEKALDAAHGADDWVLAHVEHQLYLDPAASARRGVAAEQAERTAAAACERADGVHAAWTRTQILEGRLPGTAAARAVALGFHRRVSGDVVIVPEPGWVEDRGPVASQHGSPWAYDAHVPLFVAGAGVRAGRHLGPVTTLDVAPTLCELLGVARPSGCEGRVLAEAVR